MPITKPQLPTKAGYVEVEVNGERRYRNVETGQLLGEETVPTVSERVSTLESDKADKSEVQAVWDQMAEAYSEGVSQA